MPPPFGLAGSIYSSAHMRDGDSAPPLWSRAEEEEEEAAPGTASTRGRFLGRSGDAGASSALPSAASSRARLPLPVSPLSPVSWGTAEDDEEANAEEEEEEEDDDDDDDADDDEAPSPPASCCACACASACACRLCLSLSKLFFSASAALSSATHRSSTIPW